MNRQAVPGGEQSPMTTIIGWVHDILRRDEARIDLVLRRFLDTWTLSAARDELSPECWECLLHLTPESLVSVSVPEVNGSNVIPLSSIRLIRPAFHEGPQRPTSDTRYHMRHLRIRDPWFTAIFRIKHGIIDSARTFLNEQGLIFVTPPVIGGLTEACEDVSTLFDFDYFGRKLFLSQSAQLYKEALIYSLGGVYTVYPSFRAEAHATNRHLNEYTHIEVELPFVSWEESMALQERLVQHIVGHLVASYERELAIVGRKPSELQPSLRAFPRISYTDAIGILRAKGFPIEMGDDLTAAAESVLTADMRAPVFVTRYPWQLKGFYVKKDPDDSYLALNSDLLAPEGCGEMIGGSEREDDFEAIQERINSPRQSERIAALGGTTDDYNWYLELRKYGSVPHAGFGMGCERLLKWICRLDHIRDATPFPRTLDTCHP